jgi:CDP-diacylglycerol--serine O-phosphatidyltransferase
MILESIKKQIPNLLTLANLACGVISIISVFENQIETAALFIFGAVVFDFLDGFVARMLGVSGEFGKQLDSLADVVTFGVAPSIILYHFSTESLTIDSIYFRYSFLFVALFSAYRLAKFNIDTRQTDSFIGVPTPITGVMIASWVFIANDYPNAYEFIFFTPWRFATFCLLVSLLLISELPLISLKLKNGKVLKDYIPQIIVGIIGVVGIIMFGWLGIPIIYVVYVLSSIFIKFAKK